MYSQYDLFREVPQMPSVDIRQPVRFGPEIYLFAALCNTMAQQVLYGHLVPLRMWFVFLPRLSLSYLSLLIYQLQAEIVGSRST